MRRQVCSGYVDNEDTIARWMIEICRCSVNNLNRRPDRNIVVIKSRVADAAARSIDKMYVDGFFFRH